MVSLLIVWHHVLASLHFVSLWSEINKYGQLDLSHIKMSNKFSVILKDDSHFLTIFTSIVYSYRKSVKKLLKQQSITVSPQVCQEEGVTWKQLLTLCFSIFVHAKPASCTPEARLLPRLHLFIQLIIDWSAEFSQIIDHPLIYKTLENNPEAIDSICISIKQKKKHKILSCQPEPAEFLQFCFTKIINQYRY